MSTLSSSTRKEPSRAEEADSKGERWPNARRQAVRQNGHFLEARRVQLKWQAGVSAEAAALGLGSGFEEEEVASPEGKLGIAQLRSSATKPLPRRLLIFPQPGC